MTLLELFNETYSHVVFDKTLINKFKFFRIGWGAKDDAYIEFLSSGLIGVHPIRFSSRDEAGIFVDILQIDQDDLQTKIYSVPGINRSFNVSSNVLNLSLIYFMHKFIESKLSTSDKEEAIRELYQIYAYKCIGSLYSHYFPYRVDPNVAQTIFEQLQDKYLIKKLGSWDLLFLHNAKVCYPGGNNYSRIQHFNTDNAVRVANDLQTRLKSTVKNISKVLYSFIESGGDKIKSVTLVKPGDDENEEGIKDIMNGGSKYINFIKNIIHSPNDFIIKDYLYLICKVVPNAKEDRLREVLEYISVYEFNPSPERDYISFTIRQSIAYLNRKGITHGYARDALGCLQKLKGFFSTSKVKEPEVIQAKREIEKICYKGLKQKTKWIITPLVIATMLYIFLRTISNSKN